MPTRAPAIVLLYGKYEHDNKLMEMGSTKRLRHWQTYNGSESWVLLQDILRLDSKARTEVKHGKIRWNEQKIIKDWTRVVLLWSCQLSINIWLGILINLKFISYSVSEWLRGVFLRKRMRSFGFCPNYLLPPLNPIWTTCTTFFWRRNSRFESQLRTQDR